MHRLSSFERANLSKRESLDTAVRRVWKVDHSLVMMAKRSHPFPYRTRKLSSLAPMVVGASPVRVGRR